MIPGIGRYIAAAGFFFAALMHLAGYMYIDLPYAGLEGLTLGICALVPLAMRVPVLDSHTPLDTLPKKVAARLYASGLFLWMLVTLVLIEFIRTPDTGIGPHPIRFSALLPVWRISGGHYRMLYQQWQTLSAALVFVFFWLQFSSAKTPAPAQLSTSGGSTQATGKFPPAIKRFVEGAVLATVGLFVSGRVLHIVGLVDKGPADMISALSVIGIIMAIALGGAGIIIQALRD